MGQMLSPLVREEEPEDLTNDVTTPRVIGLARGSRGLELGFPPPWFVTLPLVRDPSFTRETCNAGSSGYRLGQREGVPCSSRGYNICPGPEQKRTDTLAYEYLQKLLTPLY